MELRKPFLALLSFLSLLAPASGSGGPPPLPEPLRSAPKAVFAHVMVSFRNPARSGVWNGWAESNDKLQHDPLKLDQDGRPDIAAARYPAAGLYDMTDPDLAEYHCQLLKMAGVDGIIFHVGEYGPENDPDWRAKSVQVYVEAMKKYGLRGAVNYQESHLWQWPDGDIQNRDQAVALMYKEMDLWLKALDGVQYQVGKRPLFTVFTYEMNSNLGVSRLAPVELAGWLERFPVDARPIYLTSWFRDEFAGIADGSYAWPEIKGPAEPGTPYAESMDLERSAAARDEADRQALGLLKSGKTDFYLAGAWPGFDDLGVWGWGKAPRRIPRFDGKTYRLMWEKTTAGGIPVVQLVTWNDWNEGTQIEPSAERGARYLELTREFVAKFKGTKPSRGDFRVPLWIYRVRKVSTDAEVLEKMTHACESIQAGDYRTAYKIVKPVARRLGVLKVKYWGYNGKALPEAP